MGAKATREPNAEKSREQGAYESTLIQGKGPEKKMKTEQRWENAREQGEKGENGLPITGPQY